MKRIFIHLPPFERSCKEAGVGEEDLRQLQLFLIERPTTGDVVQGTHGIRKLRWSHGNRGKRGGLRVFYLDLPEYNRIYLVALLQKAWFLI